MLSAFISGTVQGQDGWTGGTIPIAAQVVQGVDQTGTHAHSGVGSWLISNSTANGGYNGNFAGWPFSPGLAVTAGQPSSGATADQFSATFWFQAGSSVADGSNIEIDLGTSTGDDRNSFLAITNNADGSGGLQLRASEPDGATGNFFPTQIIATGLSRTAWHRIDIVAKFNDGDANDTFQISLDGVVLANPLGGTTFGTFEGYRNGLSSPYALSNRLFFRSGAAPSAYGAFADNAASGFYIDDVTYSASSQANPNLALASYAAAFEASPSTAYVDDDWSVLAPNAPIADADLTTPGNQPAIYGVDAFSTIQNGVNAVAAGGMVIVNVGVYSQPAAGVSVNKANLTILGPNYGIPYNGARGPEAIVRGTGDNGAPAKGVFGIAADGVTIDGFRVETTTPVTLNNQQFGFGVTGDNVTIQNNIVVNSAPTGTGPSYGIAIAGPSAVNPANGTRVIGNSVSGYGLNANQHGINIGGTNTASNTLIQGNSITGNYNGIYNDRAPVGTQIIGNTITGNGRFGIVDAQGGPSTTLIAGNTITGNGNNPLGAPLFGAIQLFGSDADVMNNQIDTNSGIGVLVRPGFGGPAFVGSPNITGNSISGNTTALVNQNPGAPVDAQFNWWGTPDAAAIDTAITGNVDFSPFFTTGNDVSAAAGFQGDYSALGVSAASPGSANDLQEAINAATPGSTLTIAPGTYNGVYVDKNLILVGAGVGSTIITGNSPALIIMNGATVTTSNLTLTTSTNDPTVRVESGGNLTLRSSEVEESTGAGINQAAILVQAGGLLDVGTSGDLGANIFQVNGVGGLFINNQDDTGISALGNTFQQDATTYNNAVVADNLAIEDGITHAIDNSALGLVRYVANNVYVTSNSGSIQRGVDAAIAGDTVSVGAGTFNEGVTVNKTLTLRGAQFGVDAKTGRVGASETIVNNANGSFGVTASNVTIDGFIVQGQTSANSGPGFGAAIRLAPGVSGSIVQNNIIQNNIIGLFLTNAGPSQALVQNNLFRNNTTAGPSGGHDIYADDSTAGPGGLNNVVINSNKFTNTAFVTDAWAIGISNVNATPFTNLTITNNQIDNHGRGMYFFSTDGATITGNTITGVSRYGIGIFDSGVPGTESSNFVINNNTITTIGTGVGVSIDNAGYTGPLTVTNSGVVDVFGTAGDDSITLRMNAGVLTYTLGGNTFNLTGASGFNFNGSTGSDTLTLDYSGGNFTLPITYDGGSGAGSDSLITFGGTFTNGRVTPTGAGAGTIQYDANGIITFTGLEPITDDNFIANYIIDATIGVDAITIADNGDGIRTLVSEASALFESVAFMNKTNVTINGLGAADTFTLNNPAPATGLTSLTVDGGAGNDSLDVDAAVTLTGTITLTVETVDLNANLTAGTLTGSATLVNVNNTTAQIQDGIAVAASGATVDVAAGTFIENITINKSLTLIGEQAGVDGRNRAATETVIQTNGLVNDRIITVSAANVTIDGFTVDGNDPLFVGNLMFSGADSNAARAIRQVAGATSNLIVRNNIVKNVGIGVFGDQASQGNLVTQNWFSDIGTFDFGYAVSARNNFYTDITNNLMTEVWTGVHYNNHNGLGGPAGYSITGNEIHSYAGGILNWLKFNGASPATIASNIITAEALAVANNFGVLMVSIQDAVATTFTGNTITGHDYGIGVFNAPTSSTITLGSTNSVINSELAGVLITNNLNFNPVGTTNFIVSSLGAASTVNIAGMNITTNVATATGVRVEGITGLGAGLQQVSLTGGTTITGGATGLVVTGPLAGIAGNTLNNTNFVGQSGNYITLANTAVDGLEINGTTATFGGLTGATATKVQNYAIEDKITHATDDNTLGFVRVKAATVYVTTNSGSIQRGVDASVDGDTIVIQSGTYTESVDATAKTVALTLEGNEVGQLTIDGNLTLDAGNTLPIQLNGLGVGQYDAFTVNGVITLGGADLDLTVDPLLLPTLNPLDRVTLFTNDLADPVSGTFAGLAEGAIITVGTTRFRISYIENHAGFGDGNDISLTVMTPPVTVAFANGNLTITGTNLVDEIAINFTGVNTVTLTGNDTTNFIGPNTLGQTAGTYIVTGTITVNLLGDDDILLVRGMVPGASIAGALTVNLGDGDDIFTTTDPFLPPQLNQGFRVGQMLTVNGNAGDDQISLGGAPAADSVTAGNIMIDTGTGVNESISLDNVTTIGGQNGLGYAILKTGGTGVQSVTLGEDGANNIKNNVTITQAAGGTSYIVGISDSTVGGNVDVTIGNGALVSSSAVTVGPDNAVTGFTRVTNGNHATNLVTFTGPSTYTGNITVVNGVATTSNNIVVDGVTGGGSASAFTNGASPNNDITLGGTASNAFASQVFATNNSGVTGSNDVTVLTNTIAKGLIVQNGATSGINGALANTITLGDATHALDIGGNVQLTSSATTGAGSNSLVLNNVVIHDTLTPSGSGNVTIVNGASGTGGTSVVMGSTTAVSIRGNVTIQNQASTGLRTFALDRTTVLGGSGVNLNNVGAGNAQYAIGTVANVTIATAPGAKTGSLVIQDGSGAATVNLARLVAGGLSYTDIGGGVDTVNVAENAGELVTINGTARIDTGNDNDVVRVATTGKVEFNDSAFISLGAGDDSLRIGANAASPAFQGIQNFKLDGGIGNDTLFASPLAITGFANPLPAGLKTKIVGFETLNVI